MAMYIDQLFMKAHAKQLKGNYAAAAKLYRDLLRINPNHLDANYLLGTLLAERGQIDEARQYLEKAAGINPGSPYIKVNLGNIYKLQGDIENSKRCFSEAITLKDDLPHAHFGLGSILDYFENDLDAACQEYQKALDLSPNDPMILQAIGKTLAKSGKETAFDYFSKALALNPNIKEIHKDIGLAALNFGQSAKAAKHLKIAQMEDPQDVKVSYFLCVAEGREPEAELKRIYVQTEFDQFARGFDSYLINKLEYTAPSEIIAFLSDALSHEFHFNKAIDLGCGTGLLGMALRNHVDYLAGVDLSAKMVDIARGRGCYDELLVGDISTHLRNCSDVFDLFTASDVIIYIGSLDELFIEVTARAAQNALFVFSTESCEGDGFFLQETGRYAHSRSYIHAVAAKNNGTVLNIKQIQLRKERNNWIMGDLFLIQLK